MSGSEYRYWNVDLTTNADGTRTATKTLKKEVEAARIKAGVGIGAGVLGTAAAIAMAPLTGGMSLMALPGSLAALTVPAVDADQMEKEIAAEKADDYLVTVAQEERQAAERKNRETEMANKAISERRSSLFDNPISRGGTNMQFMSNRQRIT